MDRISGKQLCQRLRSEALAGHDAGVANNLRLRILDYFTARDFPDDTFEKVLKARLNDPDPAKEQSKVICAQILETWQGRYRNIS